jgi:hypothetical protein
MLSSTEPAIRTFEIVKDDSLNRYRLRDRFGADGTIQRDA